MLLLPLFLKDKSHDDGANILPPYKRMGRHMLSLAQFHKMFLKTINVIYIIIIITTITTTTTIGDIIIIEPVWLGMWLINWHPSRSPDFHPGYLCRLTTSWYQGIGYQGIVFQSRYWGIEVRISRFKVSGYICHFLYSKRLAPASNCNQSHGESSKPETMKH